MPLDRRDGLAQFSLPAHSAGPEVDVVHYPPMRRDRFPLAMHVARVVEALDRLRFLARANRRRKEDVIAPDDG